MNALFNETITDLKMREKYPRLCPLVVTIAKVPVLEITTSRGSIEIPSCLMPNSEDLLGGLIVRDLFLMVTTPLWRLIIRSW